MKQVSIVNATKLNFKQLIVFIGLIIGLLIINDGVYAQTDSTKTEETALTLAPSIEFITVQKSDNTIELKAAIKAKFKGSFIKLPFLKITFIQVTDSAENKLGFAITDAVGKAVFNVKADGLKKDKEGKIHFKAVFAGNKSMDATDAEVTVKRAMIVLTAIKEDSVTSIKAQLVDLGTGDATPISGSTLGVFVKRMFNPLKIGEGTTDTTGEMTLEIPAKLPGDEKGNLTLLARLDDNETYGNLEASVVQQWGVVHSNLNQALPRALWSSHPPIWMIVTFIILMTTVWGHYFVIIYELFRLKKEH